VRRHVLDGGHRRRRASAPRNAPAIELSTSRRAHRTIPCHPGINYQASFQVETLPLEIFLHVHDEILADGGKRGLLHNFQPNHRLAVAPLGYIEVEARPDCLFLSTFHTFPEENTVVKSQSLIEKKT
jgi:hypothetical protein